MYSFLICFHVFPAPLVDYSASLFSPSCRWNGSTHYNWSPALCSLSWSWSNWSCQPWWTRPHSSTTSHSTPWVYAIVQLNHTAVLHVHRIYWWHSSTVRQWCHRLKSINALEALRSSCLWVKKRKKRKQGQTSRMLNLILQYLVQK